MTSLLLTASCRVRTTVWGDFCADARETCPPRIGFESLLDLRSASPEETDVMGYLVPPAFPVLLVHQDLRGSQEHLTGRDSKARKEIWDPSVHKVIKARKEARVTSVYEAYRARKEARVLLVSRALRAKKETEVPPVCRALKVCERNHGINRF
ncbi:hypothetical protein Bbelb_320170 [Branchiostoma belcheri]|nr:hypothetical protein Bbelb_320170 [Branchiostoma belcheri]